MPLLMKQHFANALGPNPNSQLKCFAFQGFIDFLKVPRDSYSSMTLHACQAHRESPATLDASDGPGGGNLATDKLVGSGVARFIMFHCFLLLSSFSEIFLWEPKV